MPSSKRTRPRFRRARCSCPRCDRPCPLVLLNVSMGDRATVTDRRCGCPMEALGLADAPAHHPELREADRRGHDLRRHRRRTRAGGDPSAPLRRKPDRLPAHRGRRRRTAGQLSLLVHPARRTARSGGPSRSLPGRDRRRLGGRADHGAPVASRPHAPVEREPPRTGGSARFFTSGRPERRPATLAHPETAGRAGRTPDRRGHASPARLRAVISAPLMSIGGPGMAAPPAFAP